MSNECAATLVRCMDYRIERAFEEFLESHAMHDNNVDVISIAGGAKMIAEENHSFVEQQVIYQSCFIM